MAITIDYFCTLMAAQSLAKTMHENMCKFQIYNHADHSGGDQGDRFQIKFHHLYAFEQNKQTDRQTNDAGDQ